MTTNDESSTTEHDAEITHKQRTRDEGAPGTDPARGPEPDSAPRGNPETDDEAVDKGEQNLGRVVGR
jgi:hypothetical protein